MRLALKLPLIFAGSLALTLSAALYGIWSLNQTVVAYDTTVRGAQQNSIVAGELLSLFKTQVQEWKNTLLRGKDAKKLDKHWGAFIKLERDISDKARRLQGSLPPGEAHDMLEKFEATHAAMGQKYRGGYEAFKASGFDPAVGDNLVAGMDREPAKLLDEAGARIEASSLAIGIHASAQGRRAAWVSVALMLAICGAVSAVCVVFVRGLLRQLGGDPGTASDVARRVAAGDLSVDIRLTPGDTSSLMAQLQTMQTNLSQVVARVRQNSDQVATASAQIAQGNHDLSNRTELQASALQQTAASMEELGVTVKQNADHARQASQLAHNASTVAVKGGRVVGEVVATMKGIHESSSKMADIIGVIDGIAFQTNILALNAAVEAARAGEQGRGFAVVASEVRNLARRSADAAKEINCLITASVERVEQGTAFVDQAGATMGEIVESIQRVTAIMSDISAASAEQSSGVAQVGDAVSQMDQATQQNAALVEESAAAADGLRRQARELVRAVAVFRLSAAEAAQSSA